jgi:hypothetical protein
MKNDSKSTQHRRNKNRKRKSYDGHKFWWLVILQDAENLITPGWRSYRRVLALCTHCESEKEYKLDNLKSWSTVSCGCQRGRHWNQNPPLQTTHWYYGTRPYAIWMNMKRSCDNSNHHSYHRRWAKWIWYDPSRADFASRWNQRWSWYSENLYFIRKDLAKSFTKENCSREHFYPVSKQDLWQK